jgi:hypothetical protein
MWYLEPIASFNQEIRKALHQMEVLTRCCNHSEIVTIREEIEAPGFEFAAEMVLRQLQQ